MFGKLIAALVVASFVAETAPGDIFFFTDKGAFDAFNLGEGKFLKGTETFEESNVEGAGKIAFPDPLQGNVPNTDPAGIGFPNGLTQKNLIIQTNITPGPNPPSKNSPGPGDPLDAIALFVIGPGFIGSNSKKVGEDLEVLAGVEASLDLIFTEPNHTGVGFELSQFDGFGPPGDWHITVYNKSDQVIGKFILPPVNEPTKAFFGVWSDETIGRINIFDEGIIPDAIDNIQMWTEEVGEPEGCSPGFWKQPHHFDSWTAPYDPDDLFSDHFEDAFPGRTLHEVLSQRASTPPGPNQLNNLGRHTVAALLNAASPDVAFDFTPAGVIAMFNAVFPGTIMDYNALKDTFEAANEEGCPINGNSDLDGDGVVDISDLYLLLGNWGGAGTGDLDENSVVNMLDLWILFRWWGS